MSADTPAPEQPYRLDESRYSVHSHAVRHMPEGARVLEVGCARGYLSERLKRRGCRVWGIEIDTAAAEEARAHCVEVITADVDNLDAVPWPGETFDVLLFLDVLEHLKEPERAIRLLAQGLQSSGLMMVSLPNVANWYVRYSLLRGRFDYQPAGILDRTHLRFFTRTSAERILVDAGFEIVHRDLTPGVASNIYLRTVGRLLNAMKVREELEYRLTRMLPGLLTQQFFFVARRREDAG